MEIYSEVSFIACVNEKLMNAVDNFYAKNLIGFNYLSTARLFNGTQGTFLCKGKTLLLCKGNPTRYAHRIQ